MTITTLPTAPSTSDPSTFSTRADALIAALPTMITEINATTGAMTSIAAGTALSIPYTFSSTTTDADPGAGYLRLSSATQNASTVIRADLVGADAETWTSVIDTFDDSDSTIKGYIKLIKLTDATKWLIFSVSSLASPAGYKNITVTNVASSDASPFTNNDSIVLEFTRNGDKGSTGAAGNGQVGYSARTSNTILAAGDTGTLINITSGTFSQTFTAAATLGANWSCYIKNSGTGEITLDPNGAELIDGLATFIMYPNECRLIQCTGTAFVSTVIEAFSATFTATGTFTKPPGYSEFAGLLWSGGNSGQRTNNTATQANGGGGGGCIDFKLPSSLFSATETVTIGAGGTAVTTVAGGNFGGTSSLTMGSKTLSISSASSTYQYGGTFTAASTGAANPVGYEQNSVGQNPASPTIYGGGSSTHLAAGGVNLFGGGSGASIPGAGSPTTAGQSIHGGNGGAANVAISGVAGTAPGGGGGATQTGTSSGAGARGELRIWGI